MQLFKYATGEEQYLKATENKQLLMKVQDRE